MIRSPAGFDGMIRVKRYQDYYQASYGVMMLSAGQFSPLSLFAAGEQGVWYDPSDFTTMFQDAAGTTPVTALDQPVGLILDKSGRGNHASQATDISRPLLKQDANGYYYLLFDGVNDGLATSSVNFSASDTMSVFAGARKLTDASVGIVVELSASLGANSGAFYLASGQNPTAGWSSASRGTASSGAAQGTQIVVAAPDTAVLASTHNIAGDLTTFRRNTVAGPNATGDKGAGNFGNYPLYIGRRGGTTLPFSGNLYSLIVRGALVTSAQLASTEAWVNTKTGAY